MSMKSFPKKTLNADNAISQLNMKSKEGTFVSEEELKECLKQFNLRDGLVLMSRCSIHIFNDKSEYKTGMAMSTDPETGIIVAQFALAYISNILILSGSNDYKTKQLSENDNLLTLINIYNNDLIQPELVHEESDGLNEGELTSLLIRMHSEQFLYQFNYINFIARNMIMFRELVKTVTPDKFESLDRIFQNQTGINIDDYFKITMSIWATAQKSGTFKPDVIINANIPVLKSLLTQEKLSSVLAILSSDYKTFRDEDFKQNENLGSEFTKYRYNPLIHFPVLKFENTPGDTHVIPNVITYLRKGFGGLFWWFHRYFEENGKQQDFRNYFGKVFEKYIGIILKQAFGDAEVKPEITYGDNKFFDWIIEAKDKTYLFEVKAYQFPLGIKQTGSKDLIEKEIKNKVLKTIIQVYKRLNDINNFDELISYRDKRLVPIIVFQEIPLVSGHLYRKIIENELIQLENQGMKGIKSIKYFMLNVEELEQFCKYVPHVDLEDVFNAYEKAPHSGFLHELNLQTQDAIKVDYLNTVYHKFWTDTLGDN